MFVLWKFTVRASKEELTVSCSTKLLFLCSLAGKLDKPHAVVLHQLRVHPTRGLIIHTELDVVYVAPQKHYKISHSMFAHDANLTEATRAKPLISTFQ